ncbi:hypothetical protein NDU88_001986 [Pleurodeles waltl]|uniref:Uncharacterized protein n=1 Tax=Pleurodeles waltl TaxID=8319 RepID=A0AAV7NE61_PLEWA|nr:hypothetical protein NDU88_001986 [Pleurodeles waltl]
MAPPFFACVSRPLRSPGGTLWGGGGLTSSPDQVLQAGHPTHAGRLLILGSRPPLWSRSSRDPARAPWGSSPSDTGPRQPPKRGPPRGRGRRQSHSAARTRPGPAALRSSGAASRASQPPSGRHGPSAASATSGGPQGDPLPGQSSAFQARAAELGQARPSVAQSWPPTAGN